MVKSFHIAALLMSAATTYSFQADILPKAYSSRYFKISPLSSSTEETPAPPKRNDAENFITESYPTFFTKILSASGAALKALRKDDKGGFTIFVLGESAMQSLGEKRLGQLEDVRNGETTEKIAEYYTVMEPVTATELYESGGVITIAGVVPVGRSKSGGMFGIGGKEDGGVTIGSAGVKVVKSVSFDDTNGIVHEVDGQINPELMWRYMDQLRIPGSS